jgi:hypothetical protein
LLKTEVDAGQTTIRLVEDHYGQCIKWAALSYVWGGDQSFKTTTSSLSARKQSWPADKLPRTINDAVVVCQSLSVEHLWVDCLCIIQDDTDDLGRELLAMPMIYQQAWITISASTAANVSEGFLHERGYETQPGGYGTQHKRPTEVISLPYMADDGVSTGELIINESTEAKFDYHSCNPINTRAWTYQERRLSARLLDFTSHKLVFYCRTGKQCQGDGSISWENCKNTSNNRERLESMPCLYGHGLTDWHGMVEIYASKKLTFPHDNLRAISSLAELYRTESKFTYLAGLWRETLVHDLCWKSASTSSTARLGYFAPSWAWTSLGSSTTIRFSPRPVSRMDTDRNSYESQVCEEALVLDATLQQNPPNTTYGQIHDGSLTIQGRTLVTRWYYNESRLPVAQDLSLTAGFDVREEEWTKERDAHIVVTAFLLRRIMSVSNKWGTMHASFGLLLVEVSPQIYRRVGYFDEHAYVNQICSPEPEHAYALFKKHTLTIV